MYIQHIRPIALCMPNIWILEENVKISVYANILNDVCRYTSAKSSLCDSTDKDCI